MPPFPMSIAEEIPKVIAVVSRTFAVVVIFSGAAEDNHVAFHISGLDFLCARGAGHL